MSKVQIITTQVMHGKTLRTDESDLLDLPYWEVVATVQKNARHSYWEVLDTKDGVINVSHNGLVTIYSVNLVL